MKEGHNEFTQNTITIIMKKLNAKKGILFFYLQQSLQFVTRRSDRLHCLSLYYWGGYPW